MRRQLAAALGAGIVLLGACTGSGFGTPFFDLTPPSTLVGQPPTPDPPVDPAVPEPQVLLGPAFITGVEARLLGEGRLEIVVSGTLPTPCHQPRIGVGTPDPDGRISVEVWSEASAEQICAQVLQPFLGSAEVAGLREGEYTLLVAGEEVGVVEITQADAARS